MPPKPGSEADKARGKRLEKWLEEMAPDVKASYRGEVVLEVPRQTVHNWINGSKISNEGICKIIEVGGYEALATILGTKPYISSGKNMQPDSEKHIHGKGVRFWYNQYILEKRKTILDKKQDYSKLPEDAQRAIQSADNYARIQASAMRSSVGKNPKAKKYNYS